MTTKKTYIKYVPQIAKPTKIRKEFYIEAFKKAINENMAKIHIENLTVFKEYHKKKIKVYQTVINRHKRDIKNGTFRKLKNN